MKRRPLGRAGFEVGPLMFGGNVFGWTVDEERSFQLLDAFVAEGFDFIDTADVYSYWVPGNRGGESETIIGKWMKLRGNRSRVVIATKVGLEMSPTQKGLKKGYIFSAVEDSLRRLQTDYIDLYQSHRDDPETAPEETLEAFARLIEQGKVRAIGASNYSADRLSQSLQASARLGIPSYVTLQPLYNLYDRQEFERDLEPLCRKEGLSVIPYYALAAGFLTGKYRSEKDLAGKARGERVKRFLDDRGMRVLKALDAVAEAKRVTQAGVALAWLMAQPVVAAPIVSATSLEQMTDLFAAVRISLSPSELGILNAASETKP